MSSHRQRIAHLQTLDAPYISVLQPRDPKHQERKDAANANDNAITGTAWQHLYAVACCHFLRFFVLDFEQGRGWDCFGELKYLLAAIV